MIVIKIGRDPQKNDIVLDGETVSREHCIISKDDDNRFRLTDNSSNGTHVGNKLIKGKTVYLLPGEIVRIGKIKLPYLSYFKSQSIVVEDISIESIVEKIIGGVSEWTSQELQFRKNNAREIELYLQLRRGQEPKPEPKPAPEPKPTPKPKPVGGSEVYDWSVDCGQEYAVLKQAIMHPLTDLLVKISSVKKRGQIDNSSEELLRYALEDYDLKFRELYETLQNVSEKSIAAQNKFDRDMMLLDSLRLKKIMADAPLSEIREIEQRKGEISTLFDDIKTDTKNSWSKVNEEFVRKYPFLSTNQLVTSYVGEEGVSLKLFSDTVRLSKFDYQNILNRKNVVMRYDKESKQRCLDFVNTQISRMLAESQPGKLLVSMIDAEGLDGTCSEFKRLNKSLFGIYTREEEIFSHLEMQLRHAENVIQNVLHDSSQSLADVNKIRENQETYRIVVIEGFPAGISSRSTEVLKRLLKNGVRAGVNLFLLVDEDEMAKSDDNARTKKSLAALLDQADMLSYDFIQHRYPSSCFGTSNDITFDTYTNEQLAGVVKQVNRGFEHRSEDVLTFADYLLPESDWWSRQSANMIEIPFGVSEEKELVSLAITQEGGQNSAVVVGIPGSGKSVFLHSIIANAIVNYSPDELELYLMDFSGVEFNTYALHNLPHAKVIAPEAEREFGLSVLKELKAEGERRMKLCRDNEVSSIVDLRAKCPDLKMPRLLVIIDEFQKLFEIETDSISREAQSIIHIIVKEFRKFGINLILATQKLSDINSSILPKDLIANRVVFKCSPSDIGLIGLNAVPQLRPGECIYNAESGVPLANKKVQTFFITKREIDELLTRMKSFGNTHSYVPKSLITFRSDERPEFRNPDVEQQAQPDEVDVYFGQPIAISENDVCAALRRSSNDNILIIGGVEEVAQKLAINSTLSAMAYYPDRAAKWYIFNFMRSNDLLAALPAGYFGSEVFDTVFASKTTEVSEALREIKTEIDARKADEDREQRHIYLSLYAFQLAQMFKKGGRRGDDISEDGQLLGYILNNGPLVGVFTILQVDNVPNLQHLGDVVGQFTHRVALQMDERDSNKIVGSDIASRLYVMNRPSSKYRAYYFDNRNRVLVKFKPYK